MHASQFCHAAFQCNALHPRANRSVRLNTLSAQKIEACQKYQIWLDSGHHTKSPCVQTNNFSQLGKWLTGPNDRKWQLDTVSALGSTVRRKEPNPGKMVRFEECDNNGKAGKMNSIFTLQTAELNKDVLQSICEQFCESQTFISQKQLKAFSVFFPMFCSSFNFPGRLKKKDQKPWNTKHNMNLPFYWTSRNRLKWLKMKEKQKSWKDNSQGLTQ